jgi:2-oxoglutarate dehydrogenase E2 component (dihydrolipoamide succinyltransferase)
MINIPVPLLPESVSEAVISAIRVTQGQVIAKETVIIDLETDKVVLEISAPQAGTVCTVNVSVGDKVKTDDILITLNTAAMAVSAPETPVVVKESVQPVAAAMTPVTSSHQPSLKGPAARRGGIATPQPVEVAPTLGQPTLHASSSDVTRVPMSPLRKTIAKRLLLAQKEAAILTTFNEIDLTTCLDIRKTYKDAFEKKHGIKLGLMSFFTKAASYALKHYPIVNASLEEDTMVYHEAHHIGVAVSSERGLVVPVLRHVERASFADIERTIAQCALRAKEGKLSLADLTGGTFTISNGGVFGSLLSTPILNPPQSGILGLHKTQDRPVVINGQVVIRPMMYVALSYDHRIIDGRDSVGFLVAFKSAMEDFSRLLLDI